MGQSFANVQIIVKTAPIVSGYLGSTVILYLPSPTTSPWRGAAKTHYKVPAIAGAVGKLYVRSG